MEQRLNFRVGVIVSVCKWSCCVFLQEPETKVGERCLPSPPRAPCGPTWTVTALSCPASSFTTPPPSGTLLCYCCYPGLCAVHPLISLLSWNRKEVLASGLTVLVDARGAAPSPALYSALRSLQVSWLWLSYLETGALCCGAADWARARKGGFTNSGVSLMFQPLRVVLFSRSHLEKHALVRDSISAPIKTMMQLLLMRNTCRTWIVEKHL